jgi:DNA-binding NtrC family response regulator
MPLTHLFIRRFNKQYGRSVSAVAPEAEARLLAYAWPGNVRELRNVIERVMLLKKTDTIEPGELHWLETGQPVGSGDDPCHVDVPLGTGMDVLGEVTRRVVLQAWERSEHNQSRAARLLGIPRTTFQAYMQKCELPE